MIPKHEPMSCFLFIYLLGHKEGRGGRNKGPDQELRRRPRHSDRREGGENHHRVSEGTIRRWLTLVRHTHTHTHTHLSSYWMKLIIFLLFPAVSLEKSPSQRGSRAT